jgi:predicted O-methyltransferase YrrM
MVYYNLLHLTQDESENVCGPIQDTEALFLYSVVRGMRLRTILEIGGQTGYSARNFLTAFAEPEKSTMFTVDIEHVPQLAENHKVIIKDAMELTCEDLENKVLDMIFFDCHCYDVQMKVYYRLVENGMITDKTVLALHDTNTHPYQSIDWAYETEDGWIHQRPEREMVNEFVKMGYHAFNLHTQPDRHNEKMPLRHGVTLMQKFQELKV